MRCFAVVPFALVAITLCGCPQPKPRPLATFQSEDHGHSHERDNMMLTDVGDTGIHAALTAHLSQKDGNELDIFFETAVGEPKPVQLPFMNIKALARTADGKEHELEFEPAPKDERKDDPDGSCSHFVARAGWMKPTDVLTVRTAVMVRAKLVAIEWKDFNPKKYAHHED
jgi:hypothetical protein